MILHGQRRTLAETNAPTVHEVQEVVARDKGGPSLKPVWDMPFTLGGANSNSRQNLEEPRKTERPLATKHRTCTDMHACRHEP